VLWSNRRQAVLEQQVKTEQDRRKVAEERLQINSEVEVQSNLNSPVEECQQEPYWSEDRILR